MDQDIIESPAGETITPEPSLRDTLERVVEATPVETPREPSPARQERARSQPRDNGRFSRATSDGAEVPTQEQVEAATEPVLPGQEEEPPEQGQEQQPAIDAAPKSWKAGLRDKWGTLDPEVKAEVTRREREIQRAINEHAPQKQFTQQFQQVVQPHAQRYQGMGLTPLQLFKNFMEADTLLATGAMHDRATFMAKMISDYGIDIGALNDALNGADPAARPMSVVENLLNEKLAPIQSFMQQAENQRQQTAQREYHTQAAVINRMADDVANYPHFDIVAQDMADIMELNARRGVYLSPDDAYKRAVGINPQAHQAEQSRAGQQRAQVAHDAATRSLGASLSVSGSPAGLKRGVNPENLRDTIEAAWNAASGR